MTDTKALRRKIRESGLKYIYLAEQLGLSPYGLQKKIDNLSEFKASEICKLSDILGISDTEVRTIFFNHRVTENH